MNTAKDEIYIKGNVTFYCSYCGERIDVTDKIILRQTDFIKVEILHSECEDCNDIHN